MLLNLSESTACPVITSAGLAQHSFKARIFFKCSLAWNKQWKAIFCGFCHVYTLICYYLLQQFYSTVTRHNESLNRRSGASKRPFDACEPTQLSLMGLAVVQPCSPATRAMLAAAGSVWLPSHLRGGEEMLCLTKPYSLQYFQPCRNVLLYSLGWQSWGHRAITASEVAIFQWMN